MKFNEDLSGAIDGINMTLTNSNIELAKVFESDNLVFKTKMLTQINADLYVGLQFVKRDIENEIARQKNKKFWQFWK